MLALTIVLAVTNAATFAALWWHRRRPAPPHPDDHDVHEALGAVPPIGVTGRTRRLISVEILNPIELAGSRGRMLGLAGSLAPELTRRLVYERTLKTLRHELTEQRVVADVRLHTLRTDRPAPVATTAEYVDEVEVVDLDAVSGDQPPV